MKVAEVKQRFPFPYSGEFMENCCYALRQNNGLYTQCQTIRVGENSFCKGCANNMQKTGSEIPEYGTIQQRMAVGIFEYVDPKGRKPIAYTKIMKKHGLTQEQVLEEASKLNITVNPAHFVEPENVTKRGRPSTKPKEDKVKGPKGRPKKTKKVIELEDGDDDLFATLVAEANEFQEVEMTEVIPELEEKKKAEREKKEEERQKKEAERLEREAKKEAERLEREAKKAAAEKEKAEKKAAAEKAKAEREAKKAEKEAKKAEKEAKKTAKVDEKKSDDEEEADVVKKIEFEGKKYLKSKKTGIVYDYAEYVNNGEQVIVGKWNESEQKIDFNNKSDDDEEEEEEYDE